MVKTLAKPKKDFKNKVEEALIKGGSNKTDAKNKINKYYSQVIRIYAGQSLTPKEVANIIRSFASA